MASDEGQRGRWLTPDPLGGDITNPQSLNRYAYALNNPTTLTDPSGLGPCPSINGMPTICITSNADGDGDGNTPPGLGGGIGECPLYGCVPNCSIFTCGPTPNPYGGNGSGGGGPAPAPGPKPTPPIGAPQKNANPCATASNAPPPSYFQAKGFTAYTLETFPGVPAPPASGMLTNLTGVALNGYDLLNFSGPGSLNAQNYGSSPAYANYVYGVYLSAAGMSLSTALTGANLYGEFFSNYSGKNLKMGAPYTHIPAANVANITAGYNAQQNGTVCSINQQ